MKKMIASLCLFVTAACGMPYGEEEAEVESLQQGVLTDRQIQLCRSLINRALAADDVELARHYYERCMNAAADDTSRRTIRPLDPDRQIDVCRSLINRALDAGDVAAARDFYQRCVNAAADDKSRDAVRALDPDRRVATRVTRDVRDPIETRKAVTRDAATLDTTRR